MNCSKIWKWKLGVFHGGIAENVSRGTERSPIMRFIARKRGCHPRREAWLIPVMGKSAFIAIVARKSASHFANGRHFYVRLPNASLKTYPRTRRHHLDNSSSNYSILAFQIRIFCSSIHLKIFVPTSVSKTGNPNFVLNVEIVEKLEK